GGGGGCAPPQTLRGGRGGVRPGARRSPGRPRGVVLPRRLPAAAQPSGPVAGVLPRGVQAEVPQPGVPASAARGADRPQRPGRDRPGVRSALRGRARGGGQPDDGRAGEGGACGGAGRDGAGGPVAVAGRAGEAPRAGSEVAAGGPEAVAEGVRRGNTGSRRPGAGPNGDVGERPGALADAEPVAVVLALAEGANRVAPVLVRRIRPRRPRHRPPRRALIGLRLLAEFVSSSMSGPRPVPNTPGSPSRIPTRIRNEPSFGRLASPTSRGVR